MYNTKQGKHCPWSEAEKKQLLQVVQQCKQPNGRINWDNVQKQMPTRTRCQLKAQYTNKLKSHNSTYHKWTDCERIQLYLYTVMYNNDFKIIKQYFPDFTEMQLRSKASQLQKQNNKQKILMNLLQFQRYNEIQQFFSTNELRDLQERIHQVRNRVMILNGVQPDSYTVMDECFGKDRVDFIEINEIRYWNDNYRLGESLDRLEQIIKWKQRGDSPSAAPPQLQ